MAKLGGMGGYVGRDGLLVGRDGLVVGRDGLLIWRDGLVVGRDGLVVGGWVTKLVREGLVSRQRARLLYDSTLGSNPAIPQQS
jgi:hypothetical protein